MPPTYGVRSSPEDISKNIPHDYGNHHGGSHPSGVGGSKGGGESGPRPRPPILGRTRLFSVKPRKGTVACITPSVVPKPFTAEAPATRHLLRGGYYPRTVERYPRWTLSQYLVVGRGGNDQGQHRPREEVRGKSFISYGNQGTREEATHGVSRIFDPLDDKRDFKPVCPLSTGSRNPCSLRNNAWCCETRQKSGRPHLGWGASLEQGTLKQIRRRLRSTGHATDHDDKQTTRSPSLPPKRFPPLHATWALATPNRCALDMAVVWSLSSRLSATTASPSDALSSPPSRTTPPGIHAMGHEYTRPVCLARSRRRRLSPVVPSANLDRNPLPTPRAPPLGPALAPISSVAWLCR